MTNTTDYSLADQTGSAFRTELNNILSEIQSTNIGTGNPTTAVKGKIFIDDTNDKIKIYDGSNWIDLGASFTQDMGHATIASPTFTGLVTAPEVSISGTSRLKLPVGTTSQRPGSATTGDSRYNSTIGQQEIYDGTRWVGVFVPVGSVSYYAGSAPPKGYLKCNGATIADGNTAITGNDAYGDAIGTINLSKLYAIVGNKLPDLRGEFIRGATDSRSGIDETGTTAHSATAGGPTFGTGTVLRTQTDQNKEHTHSFLASNREGDPHGWSGANKAFIGDDDSAAFTQAGTGKIFTEGGTETRPRNVTLLAIIKY